MKVKLEKLLEYLKHFQESRVLVVGDIMLDHYIWGGVERISPEAPVPVVNVINESYQLGGAANVLNNVVSLGASGHLLGVGGRDLFGEQLIDLLKKHGIDPGGVIIDPLRGTTKKTRIIAHGQHVVRFDRENSSPLSMELEEKLLDLLVEKLEVSDSVIVSDYAKGVISEKIVRELIDRSKNQGKPVIIDPKANRFSFYKGATLATPNALEAGDASGIKINDEATLLKAGGILKSNLGSKGILITRGEAGMTLFEGSSIVNIPTVGKKVFDVTGAGDTVTAALGVCLGIGASLLEASIIANYCAGLVVEEVGTATVKKPMLEERLTKEYNLSSAFPG